MRLNRLPLVLLITSTFVACGGGSGSSPSTVNGTPASPATVTENSTITEASGVAPTDTPSGPAPWSLVVVGDSIPFNSPDDCLGCTGFVDRYADAIVQATGHPVEVENLSQHNGLQIDGLLDELKTDSVRRDALANADIVVVGIAHNDTPWGRNDDPCDGPNGDNPDWSKYDAACAAAAAELFRPKYESVYAQIVALRAGKPTILRTINRYNDWIGWTGGAVPPEAVEATRVVLDAWSAMICEAAQANGFTCADIYHAFNGADGLTPSPDLLAKDYVHPSDKGNEVIASTLAELGYAPLAPDVAAGPVWAGQVGSVCDRYEQGYESVPESDGTAAGVAAAVAARRQILDGPRFAAVDLPGEVMPAIDRANVLIDDALSSLATAEQAATAGDFDSADTALLTSDDQVTRIFQTWILAGVPCGGDPVRAAAAELNVALEMSPFQLATGFGSIWAVESFAGRVVRIDPDDGTVQASIAVGDRPFKLQPADGAMWQRTGDSYVRIDPTTNTVSGTLAKADVGPDANRSWAVDGAMWICDGRRLHRYDPTTIAAVTTIDLDIDCGQVYATDDLVVTWTYNEDDGESGDSAAEFIDPVTNQAIKTVSLPFDVGVPIVVDDAVFFPGMLGATAVVVERPTWTIAATPDLGRPTGASQSGFDGKFIYVGTADHEDVLKVDAATYAVADTITPLHANTVIVANGALWTADGGRFDVVQRFAISD